MSKKVLSDAGVGRAMFATRVRLSLKAAEMCLFYGALPCFVTPLLYWWINTPQQELSIARLIMFSKLVPTWLSMRMNFQDKDGSSALVLIKDNTGTVYDWVKPEVVTQVFSDMQAPLLNLKHAFWVAIICSLLGYAFIWFMLRRSGAGAQDNTRIRGALDLVSETKIKQIVRKLGPSPYNLVGVPLPKAALGMGFLVLGAQRSGKSMAIHDLMLQVFAQKRKCVIYDQSGEFYQAHFRPGVDHLFNPTLEGSVPWSIFSELKFTYDSDTLARAFLPPAPNGGSGEFFRDAARALFSVLLVRLTQHSAINTRDLARAFLEMPAEEMDTLIRNSVASSSIGGDSKQQRQGVLSSIAIYLNGIGAVGIGDWSVREWLDTPGDARLFIVNTRDTQAMFAPLYRLMLSIAFSNIAARQEIVHEDRYWFFLDELHQLGDINLDEHMATLGKFGVSVVTGLQSDSQLVATMGQARADTLMNCLNTALLLLAQEDNLQKRAAKRLGELEVNTVNRNQALAVAESRDGAGLNNLEAQKWVVMPSSFGALKPLTGYLKIMSEPGVKVDYRSWNQSGWFRGPYRDKWKAKQALPAKNPSFLIERPEHTVAFEQIRATIATERDAEKAATASQVSAPATPAAPATTAAPTAPATPANTTPVSVAETPNSAETSQVTDAPPSPSEGDSKTTAAAPLNATNQSLPVQANSAPNPAKQRIDPVLLPAAVTAGGTILDAAAGVVAGPTGGTQLAIELGDAGAAPTVDNWQQLSE